MENSSSEEEGVVKKLLKDYENMRKTNKFTDMEIKPKGGGIIPVHASILAGKIFTLNDFEFYKKNFF